VRTSNPIISFHSHFITYSLLIILFILYLFIVYLTNLSLNQTMQYSVEKLDDYK
jgi:hypothetical protein